jgi:thiamine kinase-like enzyme
MVRRCHCDIPLHLRGPAAMFWVFHVVRDYGHTLSEGNSRHAPLLPDLLARAARLEAAVGPIEVVFGHNDLLAANFIDDGKRLWLVDWEYAGFNSPLFDLGGLASNSEFSLEQAEAALTLYFGKPVDDALRRRAAAMTAASLLRETMWSMVSEIYSTVDFDYGAYTAENLRRFEAAYAAFQGMDNP